MVLLLPLPFPIPELILDWMDDGTMDDKGFAKAQALDGDHDITANLIFDSELGEKRIDRHGQWRT